MIAGPFVMSRSCQAFDLRLDECAEFLRILDYILLAADAVSASFGWLFVYLHLWSLWFILFGARPSLRITAGCLSKPTHTRTDWPSA